MVTKLQKMNRATLLSPQVLDIEDITDSGDMGGAKYSSAFRPFLYAMYVYESPPQWSRLILMFPVRYQITDPLDVPFRSSRPDRGVPTLDLLENGAYPC